MTALVHLPTALAIGIGWLLLAALTAPAIGRWIRGPRPDFEAQDRERVGLSPVLTDADRRKERATRGEFRHHTRYGRAS